MVVFGDSCLLFGPEALMRVVWMSLFIFGYLKKTSSICGKCVLVIFLCFSVFPLFLLVWDLVKEEVLFEYVREGF